MDPLSALSLAGNVIQFVDFGTKLISKSVEIYKSADGSLATNQDLRANTAHLAVIATRLEVPMTGQVQLLELSMNEIALQQLSRSCKEVADELLGILSGLVARKSNKKWNSVRKALNSVWKEQEIERLESRLNTFRQQLVLHLVASLRDKQSSVTVQLENLYKTHRHIEIQNAESFENLGAALLASIEACAKKIQMGKNNVCLTDDEIPGGLSALATRASRLHVELSVLKSLKFSDISTRYENVRDAHEKTFDWVFDERNNALGEELRLKVNLHEWLEHCGGVYWITGKAGSGKSTLMKYLIDCPKTKEALRKWAAPDEMVMASFFFWISGTKEQRSQEGLLQTLLLEILRQCPSIIPDVCPARWEMYHGHERVDLPRSPNELWGRAELYRAFGRIKDLHNSMAKKFCFFIDGLDEYDGDHFELVDLLSSFGNSPNIKLCISSRPWNVFRGAYGQSTYQLKLEDLTRNDMRIYIRDLLEQDKHFIKLKKNDHRGQELIQEIANKAQGVFLWVFLVVRSLLRGFTNADTIAELQRRLEEFPSDLKEFFWRMLGSLDEFYNNETARILLLLTANTSNWHFELISFAFLDQHSSNFALNTTVPWTTSNDLSAVESALKTRLNARCKDLLDFIDVRLPEHSPEWGWLFIRPGYSLRRIMHLVNFSHRTVRDFLLSPEVKTKLVTWLSYPFNPEVHLCNAMVLLMESYSVLMEDCEKAASIITNLEIFFDYASMIEAKHETLDIMIFDKIDHILHSSGIGYIDKFTPPSCLRKILDHGRNTTGALAVHKGLHFHVTRMLETRPTLISGFAGTPLLMFALHLFTTTPTSMPEFCLCVFELEGIITMVKLLLSKGASPNDQYGQCSVWEHLLSALVGKRPYVARHSLLIETFLEHGADPYLTLSSNSSRWYMDSGTVKRVSKEPRPECIYTMSQIIDKVCCHDKKEDAIRVQKLLSQKRSEAQPGTLV